MSTITRESPYSTAYDLYGDPHKLVEYRLFVLNECSMTCKGCFYNKLQNDFNDFAGALSLAKELVENDYQLETCYLLPTDIFDNQDNYALFEIPEFRETLNLFSFVGIAATLEEGFDPTLPTNPLSNAISSYSKNATGIVLLSTWPLTPALS